MTPRGALARDGAPWVLCGMPDAGTPATTTTLRTHAAVRAAAKDWATFSSDLQGDADVRDYRQLPLEADPPAHGAWRALLLPAFGRVEVARMEPALRAAARAIVAAAVARGRFDAVHDVAFPMVLRALAIAFRREQDVAEWASWGVETWRVHADGTRDGAHLERYLDRVLAEAAVAPDPDGDLFAWLAAATIDGRPLTHVERKGVANLVLAGGRDTVVKLVAGALRHLAHHPADLAWLAAEPSRLGTAIEEWLRVLSPLPRMAREVRGDATAHGCPVAHGARVTLDFAAANHDASVFEAPCDVRLDRRPNPHVAFGAGPHTCVGAHLAKVQARVLLEALLETGATLAPDGEAGIEWIDAGPGARVPLRLHHVPLRVVVATG